MSTEVAEWEKVEAARLAAVKVLLHNAAGPFQGLPRTAGFGYPEPYTRDLMLAMLGICVSGNEQLLHSGRRVLETLADNQSPRGHIPSLVHDPDDRGASDTTPLFLLAAAIFREVTGECNFLEDAVQRGLEWMAYQSPSDMYLIAQQPTSDWRDEQWVLGFGLFVNVVAYAARRLLGQHELADGMQRDMHHLTIINECYHHTQEGFALPDRPYFALWAYKVYCSTRFDLLGNSLAILTGLASAEKAIQIVTWVESNCADLRKNDKLAVDLPPNLFPYIYPDDEDWIPRYGQFNLPGNYHNGGIWPFISSLYVAALVAAGQHEQALTQLMRLTDLIRQGRDTTLEYGFNEWYKAQTGKPSGVDWQTWSAALYLYAVKCVETGDTPFFAGLRHSNRIETNR